ncbi:MAG: hypothetical protein ACOVNY_09175, partial [Chitinophagaceae bacterium]
MTYQKNITKLGLLVFSLVSTMHLIAQNSIKQKNIFNISGNIETIDKAPGGFLLVGSSNGLSGIEANSSTVKYTYTKMGKIKAD